MTALLALGLLLAPGAVSLLTGARLRHLTDDAALPERLACRRRLVTQASVASAVLTLAAAPEHAAWSLPAMLLASLALGYPTRRALFGESMGVVTYVAHAVRWILAGFGFWIGLACAPALASTAPWAPALVSIGLIAWAAAPASTFAWMVGATRVARADLEAGFASVIARSRIPAPRVLVAGHAGSRWANAFALPSLTRPAVVFTRWLLESFPSDEIVAVFAHELAHLEHHDRRRTRLAFALTALLVGAAAFGVPRLAQTWTWDGLPRWAWPLLLFVGLLVRAARHQGHEAESDRRAIELLGRPEALERALIRLHATARLPRRFDPATERSASHPSLARRLQALRAQRDLAPAPAGVVVLESVRPGAAIVLEADRAHWLEGVPPDAPRDAALRDRAARTRSLSYAELAALHVHVGWAGRAVLKATDASGRSWSEPLRPADVALAQAALDRVDTRFGAARPSPWLSPAFPSLVCAALLLASILAGRVGVFLLPAFAALLAPTPPLLVASGVAAALELGTGAPLEALRIPNAELARGAMPLLALVVLGMGAWQARRESRWGVPATLVAALLGLAAAVSGAGLVVAALGEPRMARVYMVAAERTGAGVALLALASMAFAVRRWGWSAWLAALAALPFLAGSPATARLSGDPFLVPSPALRSLERTLAEVSRVPLEAPASDLRLSPDARHWAVRERAAGEEEPAARFRVGRFAAGSRLLDAADIVFLPDGRLLRLRDAAGRSALEVLDPDDASAWRVELPRFAGAAIELGGDGLEWRVTGWSLEDRRLVTVSGRVAETALRTRASDATTSGGHLLQYVAGTRETLAIRWRARADHLAVFSAVAGVPLTEIELLWSGEASGRPFATTSSPVRCLARKATADFVCVTSHAGRTRFFRLAEGSRIPEPIGTLRARTWREQLGTDGRIYAWEHGGSFVELDFAAGEARRLRFGDEGRHVQSLALAPGYVAALEVGASNSVSLHRLP